MGRPKKGTAAHGPNKNIYNAKYNVTRRVSVLLEKLKRVTGRESLFIFKNKPGEFQYFSTSGDPLRLIEEFKAGKIRPIADESVERYRQNKTEIDNKPPKDFSWTKQNNSDHAVPQNFVISLPPNMIPLINNALPGATNSAVFGSPSSSTVGNISSPLGEGGTATCYVIPGTTILPNFGTNHSTGDSVPGSVASGLQIAGSPVVSTDHGNYAGNRSSSDGNAEKLMRMTVIGSPVAQSAMMPVAPRKLAPKPAPCTAPILHPNEFRKQNKRKQQPKRAAVEAVKTEPPDELSDSAQFAHSNSPMEIPAADLMDSDFGEETQGDAGLGVIKLEVDDTLEIIKGICD